MLFNSVDQTLKWAYNTTARPVVKLSSIYSMRGPASTAKDLSPYERRAQAAQVQRMVDEMEFLRRAYVHANYGREISEDEFDGLIAYCSMAMPALRAKRGIVMLCSDYMGQHVGWRALRQSLSCRNDDVPVIRSRIFEALDTLHEGVIDALQMRFIRVGLIEREIS